MTDFAFSRERGADDEADPVKGPSGRCAESALDRASGACRQSDSEISLTTNQDCLSREEAGLGRGDPERLRREIAEERRAGMAFDDGEFDPEVRCVALPVLDFSGQGIGAIGISRLVWRVSVETLQKRAPRAR